MSQRDTCVIVAERRTLRFGEGSSAKVGIVVSGHARFVRAFLAVAAVVVLVTAGWVLLTPGTRQRSRRDRSVHTSSRSTRDSTIVSRAHRAPRVTEGAASGLSGVVVDEFGAGVAGAILECEEKPVVPRRGTPERWLVRSDPRGHFEVNVPAFTILDLTARCSGYGVFVAKGLVAPARLSVRLLRERRLTVVVVDEQGRPVPGAEVQCFTHQVVQPGSWGWGGSRFVATTDADGACEFAGIAGTGLVVFHASHPLFGSCDRNVCIPDASRLPVKLRLSGTKVRGVVVAQETGRPIVGARVARDVFLKNAVETDDEGKFVLARPLPGRIYVVAAGYALQWATAREGDFLTFRLRPGVAVRGRVVRANGEAVGGAHVRLTGAVGIPRYVDVAFHEATTNRDGSFRIRDLRPGIECGLIVHDPEGRGTATVDFALEETERDLGRIVLTKVRTIRGVLEYEDGRPAAGIMTELERAQPAVRGVRRADTPLTVIYGGSWRIVTNATGAFRFGGLAPGRYELRLAEGGVKRVLDLRRAESKDLRIRLPWSRVVSVFVKSLPGTRPTGISVRAGTNRRIMYGASRRPGLARIRLREGERIKWIEARSSTEAGAPVVARTVGIDEDADTVVVELGAQGFLAGEVRFSNGRGVPKAVVELTAGGLVTSALCDEEGRFRVGFSGPSSQSLTVAWKGFVLDGGRRSYCGEEGVTSGVALGAEDIVVSGRPVALDGSIVVRVLDDSGAGIAGAWVAVSPYGADPVATDSNGRATLGGLPRRRVQVMATTPDRAWIEPVDSFADGRSVTLRTARRGGTPGMVFWPNGKGAAGVHVRVTDAKGRVVATARTARDGSFLVTVPVSGEGMVVTATGTRGGDVYTGKQDMTYGVGTDIHLKRAP